MNLVVTGLSHHTSPLELRERLHFPEASIPNALLRLRQSLGGAGMVILSTCNRVEIYASTESAADKSNDILRRFLGEWHGVPESDYRGALYQYEGRETAGHLFRVASSIDSLVVGEAQILGQVHDAYLLAQTEQCTDKVISALFQRAFAIAKEIRSQTNIGAGTVSIGSVAVDLAVSIFSDLAGKTAMIVGSGKMGGATLRSLVSRGVDNVLLVNRSHDRAVNLAEQVRGEAVPFDALEENLPRADIIISSTAAPHHLLGPAQFQRALRRRGNAPFFVIDIAVPRNIDPAVKRMDNVYLYDIDDLQTVANANMEARRQEIDLCMRRIESGVDHYWAWLQGLAAEPTIVSMAAGIHQIRERELQKTLVQLPDLGEHDHAVREIFTEFSKRFANAVLHQPTVQLKREVVDHDPHTVLHLVKRLFGLKESS
ncbi:MAG: glutamyl-tRNA reductase [Candidatus Hydrogenedentes bacterium]|nr:glutamyl-tRNA reductase [Candidatus Hydrogenedentota bacterium]